MKTISVAKALSEIPGLEVGSEVPLSRLTTFRIGGPAAVVASPESAEALLESAPSPPGISRLELRLADSISPRDVAEILEALIDLYEIVSGDEPADLRM